jgi:hypothetical protein
MRKFLEKKGSVLLRSETENTTAVTPRTVLQRSLYNIRGTSEVAYEHASLSQRRAYSADTESFALFNVLLSPL